MSSPTRNTSSGSGATPSPNTSPWNVANKDDPAGPWTTVTSAKPLTKKAWPELPDPKAAAGKPAASSERASKKQSAAGGSAEGSGVTKDRREGKGSKASEDTTVKKDVTASAKTSATATTATKNDTTRNVSAGPSFAKDDFKITGGGIDISRGPGISGRSQSMAAPSLNNKSEQEIGARNTFQKSTSLDSQPKNSKGKGKQVDTSNEGSPTRSHRRSESAFESGAESGFGIVSDVAAGFGASPGFGRATSGYLKSYRGGSQNSKRSTSGMTTAEGSSNTSSSADPFGPIADEHYQSHRSSSRASDQETLVPEGMFTSGPEVAPPAGLAAVARQQTMDRTPVPGIALSNFAMNPVTFFYYVQQNAPRIWSEVWAAIDQIRKLKIQKKESTATIESLQAALTANAMEIHHLKQQNLDRDCMYYNLRKQFPPLLEQIRRQRQIIIDNGCDHDGLDMREITVPEVEFNLELEERSIVAMTNARGPETRLTGCYMCGRMGHVSDHCPRRPVPKRSGRDNAAAPSSQYVGNRAICFFCQSPEHIARDCPVGPKKKAKNTGTEATTTDTVSEPDDDDYDSSITEIYTGENHTRGRGVGLPVTVTEAQAAREREESMESEGGTGALNPGAPIFVPSTHTSPNRVSEVTNARDVANDHSETTSAPILSPMFDRMEMQQQQQSAPVHPMGAYGHYVAQSQPGSSSAAASGAAQLVSSANINTTLLRSAVDALTPKFKIVCPNSFLSPGPCPQNCTFALLCDNFNILGRAHCHGRCAKVHILRSCPAELQKTPCSWAQVRARNLRRHGRERELRAEHMAKYVHERSCAPAEWQARLAMVVLADFHRRGAY